MRKIRCLAIAGLLAVLATAGWAEEWTLRKECSNGKLYQVGSQRVLMVWGRPYEMGKAHGLLLKDDVQALIQRVLKFCMMMDMVREKNPTAGSLAKAYERLKPHIPERFQEEMRGLSDGAGIPRTPWETPWRAAVCATRERVSRTVPLQRIRDVR